MIPRPIRAGTSIGGVASALQSRCAIIPITGSGWATGTLSGAVANNSAFPSGGPAAFLARVAAATAGAGRQTSFNTAATVPYPIFPGTVSQIDLAKPWILEFYGNVKAGNLGGVVNILIGKSSGAGANPTTLDDKGFGIRWTGGASQSVGLIHWDTALRSSSTATEANNGTAFSSYVLVWLPGTGLFLYKDGALLVSNQSNLPTGLTTAGNANLQFTIENTVGNALLAEFTFIGVTLSHLNPSFL